MQCNAHDDNEEHQEKDHARDQERELADAALKFVLRRPQCEAPRNLAECSLFTGSQHLGRRSAASDGSSKKDQARRIWICLRFHLRRHRLFLHGHGFARERCLLDIKITGLQ